MRTTVWAGDYDGQPNQRDLALRRLRPVIAGTKIGAERDDQLLIADVPEDGPYDPATIRNLIVTILDHSGYLPL